MKSTDRIRSALVYHERDTLAIARSEKNRRASSLGWTLDRFEGYAEGVAYAYRWVLEDENKSRVDPELHALVAKITKKTIPEMTVIELLAILDIELARSHPDASLNGVVRAAIENVRERYETLATIARHRPNCDFIVFKFDSLAKCTCEYVSRTLGALKSVIDTTETGF